MSNTDNDDELIGITKEQLERMPNILVEISKLPPMYDLSGDVKEFPPKSRMHNEDGEPY
jgi:hypothetical protein